MILGNGGNYLPVKVKSPTLQFTLKNTMAMDKSCCKFTVVMSVTCRYALSSVWGIVGGSRDRIPVGARFSALVQTVLGAYQTSYTKDTGAVFRG